MGADCPPGLLIRSQGPRLDIYFISSGLNSIAAEWGKGASVLFWPFALAKAEGGGLRPRELLNLDPGEVGVPFKLK